jgi:hypothetical protein
VIQTRNITPFRFRFLLTLQWGLSGDLDLEASEGRLRFQLHFRPFVGMKKAGLPRLERNAATRTFVSSTISRIIKQITDHSLPWHADIGLVLHYLPASGAIDGGLFRYPRAAFENRFGGHGGDDGARTRDLRRDRKNVSGILGPYSLVFNGLVASLGEQFSSCYSTCFSSSSSGF